MKRKNIKKKYKNKRWCDLIAFLINSDNCRYKFTEKIYTHENCWKCNSHGELFGILNSIECVKSVLEKNVLLSDKMHNTYIDILDGKNINPNKEFSTVLGLHCLRQMWNCPSDLNNFVDKSLRM